MDSKLVQQAVVQHARSFWGHDSEIEPFRWTAGPIGASLPAFEVLRVRPRSATDPWAYLSCGAAAAGSDRRHEYLLLSSSESPIHVETLAMVAHFHADPTFGGVHLGKVMDIGRAWVDGSAATHLFVFLPYPCGPVLELCTTEAAAIRVLWLMPITASEGEFARRNGQEALERKFDDAEVVFADPLRPSVA